MFNLSHLVRRPVPVRLGLFVVLLLLIWLPLAIPIYWLGGDPNWVSIITLVLLYCQFLILLQWWGKSVYGQPRYLRVCGLEISRRSGEGLLIGLGLGWVGVLGIFAIATGFGWLKWQPFPANFPIIIIESLLVSLGVGFAEELLFRGWLLEELRRDYSPVKSLWVSSVIFALLHFIKPWEEIVRTWLQFPGLLLLGIILVWAKDVTRTPNHPHGSLALAIGLHGGLVGAYYIINVGELTMNLGKVPPWVTGIDSNPLAGLLGLLGLGAIAIIIRQLNPSATKPDQNTD
ncbi:CPBP family intramembrane glutamic endopeptidase [Limnospira fusiformis]|uniref:CPBP family intramembrane glutamic endopeptidase n=1 Tax=Limnospira fusiformis TaxID=54297 RepID=UPI0034E0E332